METDIASQPRLPCRSLASSGRCGLPFCRCFLQVWIEFGRIKLPQGYHPNDVEEEWGKLIIEMLEREKLLRPAVERLEPLCALQGHPCAQRVTQRLPHFLPSISSGWNCCYKSPTKSRTAL